MNPPRLAVLTRPAVEAAGSRTVQVATGGGRSDATWPERSWHGRSRAEPSELGRMLGLLARLGDASLAERMFDKLMRQRGHDTADNPAVLDALSLLPDDHTADWLRKVVEANGFEALGSCCALLAAALDGNFAKTPKLLLAAGQALLNQLPGDPVSAPKDQWDRPRVANADATCVADLVGVVDRIDAGLAKRTADHILAWPRHFDRDHIVVPAIKKLLTSRRPGGTACEALHAAGVAHLNTRIAEPLEAPQDWTRPSGIGCNCQYCADLAKFLADPGRESWTLRAAQQARTHVETEIRRANADLDTETLRKGSPHSLIAVKNQASYERRVAQRKQDLADLAVLNSGAGQSSLHRRN